MKCTVNNTIPCISRTTLHTCTSNNTYRSGDSKEIIEYNDLNDNTSYIVTLYTKTYKIQIDRTIIIKKYRNLTEESIEVNEYSVKLNLLQNREFIKGTIEIKEIDDNINQIMYGQFNI